MDFYNFAKKRYTRDKQNNLIHQMILCRYKIKFES